MGFKLGRKAGKRRCGTFCQVSLPKNDKPPVEFIAESTAVALNRATHLLALDSKPQQYIGEGLICLNIIVDAIWVAPMEKVCPKSPFEQPKDSVQAD